MLPISRVFFVICRRHLFLAVNPLLQLLQLLASATFLSKSAQQLGLINNQIGDAGAEALAKAFPQMKGLQASWQNLSIAEHA